MSVERISVERLEVEFSADLWGRRRSNVAIATEWLQLSFLNAARRYKFAPTESDLRYLSNPPLSVMDWTLRRASISPDAGGMPWVKDAATALHAFRTGGDPDVDRKSLTKAERRSADTQAQYFVSVGRIWQKGLPVDFDIPLLLYLIFSIEILTGRRFPQSRPNSDLNKRTPPGGPAFRLLQAAYSLASFRAPVMPSGMETIYQVALIARTDAFKRAIVGCGGQPWVGWSHSTLSLPEIVERHPNQCAYLFADGRRSGRTGRIS